MGASNLADLGNGLDGTDFVVGVHDADHGRTGANCLFYVAWIHHAISVHGNVGDFKSELHFQLLCCVADGVMFDGGGDNVVLLGPVAALKGHAAQSQVVALGATTGENHLVGRTIQDLGNHLACLVQGMVGFASQIVDA